MTLGVVTAGELIGEVAVLAGSARTATLRAIENSVVIGVPRADFERWLVSRPELADEIALAATERLGRNLVAEMLTELVDAREIALIDDVLALMEWRRLETGENLFRQGDLADAAYFVVSGRLGVTERRTDGTRVLLREVGKGAMLGELGLIDNAQRSATVHVLRDATLARLSGEAFSTLVTRHPPFALHVTRAVI